MKEKVKHKYVYHVQPDKAEKILSRTKEKSFKLHMGAEIFSLRNLYEAFDIMSDETFEHHVRDSKNDFANWIENVFEDYDLAEHLRKLKTKEAMKKVLGERIEFLEKRAVAGRPLYHNEYMDHAVRDFVVGLIVGIIIGFAIKYIATIFG